MNNDFSQNDINSVNQNNVDENLNNNFNQVASNSISNNDNSQFVSHPIQQNTDNVLINNSNSSVVEENMTMGIIGAFIGAFIGSIVLILLYQIGFIAAVSGIAISSLALIGYEKLAKGISKKGIIACIIVVVIVVFLAQNLAIAMAVSNELAKHNIQFSTFEVLKSLPNLFKTGNVSFGSYMFDLILEYVFCFVGAFSIYKNKLNILK